MSEESARILIVDDSADGREFVHRVLARAGHRVRQAATIADAWEQLDDGLEAVIIDVNLPDGSGLELTRALRARPEFIDLAIVQSSALDLAPAQRAAGLDSGADAYLVHPVPPAVLVSTVAAMIRVRRVERSLRERDRDLRSALDAGGVMIARLELTNGTLIERSDHEAGHLGLRLTNGALRQQIHHEDLAAFDHALSLARRGVVAEAECRVLIPGLPSRHLLIRAEPLLAETEATVARAILVDVTSRRAFDQQLTVVQDMIEAAGPVSTVAEIGRLVLPAVRAAWALDIVALFLLEGDQISMALTEGVELGEIEQWAPVGPGVIGEVVRTGRPVLVVDVAASDGSARDPHLQFMRAIVTTAMVVPLISGDQAVVGVLVLGSATAREFTPQEMQLLSLLGGRLAGAVRRAQATDAQHALVVALQQHLLPSVPLNPAAVAMAVRYVASDHRLEVGGDWYDGLELRDGRTLLIVGDVTGKGAQAAAAMGRIRAYSHALADRCDGPAELLDALNALVVAGDFSALATMCCLQLDADGSHGALALAGHPPPLVALAVPGGPPASVSLMTAIPGPPLGASVDAKYRNHPVEVLPGMIFALYTDGLVERRQERIDVGIARLADALRAALSQGHQSVDPERVADHLLAACTPPSGQEDDIALLVACTLVAPPS